MGDVFKECYTCGKSCVNSQFCLSDGNVQANLPRDLYIEIQANPEYWGFGGVVASGWTHFSQGFYDYFDNYDPDFNTDYSCGIVTVEDVNDVLRPDIKYAAASVPDGADLFLPDDLDVGGAEAFLTNYTEGFTDQAPCDTNNPRNVFKWNWYNYSYRPKILFNDNIFKNITSAWRGGDCAVCYDGGEAYLGTGCPTCSGEHKMSIWHDDTLATFYDHSNVTCVDQAGCKQDGEVVGNYAGNLTVVGISGVPIYTATYQGGEASKIFDGDIVFVDNVTGVTTNKVIEGAGYIFDVSHNGSDTSFKIVGKASVSGSWTGSWVALNRPDAETCCGGRAFGIDITNKRDSNEYSWHIDNDRVFNNPKNKLLSNRGAINVDDYGNCTLRRDPRYVGVKGACDISGTGTPHLITDDSGVPSSIPFNPMTFPYFGIADRVDEIDDCKRVKFDSNNIKFQNKTCYTSTQDISVFPDCLLQSCSYFDEAEGVTKYRRNLVPRIGIVYRPCEFADACTYHDDGRPMTAGGDGMPSTLTDLRRGYGGQETIMYINMGTSWVSIPSCKRAIYTTSKSPVTFPCFPKFDLYPENYGCEDELWYNWVRNEIGLVDTGDIFCNGPTYLDACLARQPYPTYGFTRNLCGHRDADSRSVIENLSNNTHAGDFTDINNISSTLEPMYLAQETGLPYWGRTDDDGALASHYFYSNTCSHPTVGDYECEDMMAYYLTGFPTTGVPFLVKIDHRDYCVGCGTTQLDASQTYTLTIESKDTKFLHAHNYDNYAEGLQYGFHHCAYGGFDTPIVVPSYNEFTGEWDIGDHGCGDPEGVFGTGVPSGVSGSGVKAFSEPYVGETCACAATTTTMYPQAVSGTDIPKYYSTWNGKNDYVPWGDCGTDFVTNDTETYFGSWKDPFEVYFRASYSCLPDSALGGGYDYISYFTGLDSLLGCGGCTHSIPATNSKAEFYMDFYLVNKKYKDVFTSIPNHALLMNESWLENGLGFSVSQCNYSHNPSGTGGCTYGDQDCGECSGTALVPINVNIAGCPGASIDIFGCPVTFDPASGEAGDRTCTGGGFMTTYCLQNPCLCLVGTGVGNNCCGKDDRWDTCDDANEWRYGCYEYTECLQVEYDFEIPGPLGLCNCQEGNIGLLVRASWQESPCNPGTYGWYGEFYAPPREMMGSAGGAIPTYWSGVVPGVGPVPLMPVSEWIAFREDSTTFQNAFGDGGCGASPASVCSYDQGPNRLTDIGATFTIPSRHGLFEAQGLQLTPEKCTTTNASGITKPSMCGIPIPFGSYGSPRTVEVNKRYCWPEIMTVHKVECTPSGTYKLHVEREFYEHDRKRYHVTIVDGVAVANTLYGRVDGGGTASLHTGDGFSTSCTPSGSMPTGTVTSTSPYYAKIPMFTPTDSVTPCFPDVCASSTMTFRKTLQFTPSCLYPNMTGEYFWNHYNTFYDIDVPDTRFEDDACAGCYEDPESDDPYPFNLVCLSADPSGDPYFGTNDSGVSLKCRHSCFQDEEHCGGLFWCDKEFVPRRNYLAGTKVARLSAHSICAQRGNPENPNWAFGHSSTNTDTTEHIVPVPEMFVDYCKSENVTDLSADVDIDAHVIEVDSIWPLIGHHPGFKADLDVKTCIYATGCYDDLPLHNVYTINKLNPPKPYITEADQCLLTPFKIMVDVQCCQERMGIGSEQDPTYLSWIVSSINSVLCEGYKRDCTSNCITCQTGNFNDAEFIHVSGYQLHPANERVCYSGSEYLYPPSGEAIPTGCATGVPITMWDVPNVPSKFIANLSDAGNLPGDGCFDSIESGLAYNCSTPDICDPSGESMNESYYLELVEWEGEKYVRVDWCWDFFKFNGEWFVRWDNPSPGNCVDKCGLTWCDVEQSFKIEVAGSGCEDLQGPVDAALSAGTGGFCSFYDCDYLRHVGHESCYCRTCGGGCGCTSVVQATITESI